MAGHYVGGGGGDVEFYSVVSNFFEYYSEIVHILFQIELHDRKQIPIPNSWGVDGRGKVKICTLS